MRVRSWSFFDASWRGDNDGAVRHSPARIRRPAASPRLRQARLEPAAAMEPKRREVVLGGGETRRGGAVVAASSCEEAPLRRETMEAGVAASGLDLGGYEAGKGDIAAVTARGA